MLVRGPFQRVLGVSGLALDDDHASGRSGRGPRGLGLRGLHRILDVEGVQSGFSGAHFHGKSARQFALAALQGLTDVRAEALAEGGLQDGAALGIGGHESHQDAGKRKDAASAGDDLDLAFDLGQNRAMEQQQFVGIGRAEHALGEAMESALDGLLDFGKKAHG